MAIDPPPPWHPKLSPPAQAILDDPSSVSEETLVAGIAEGEKRIMGRNLQGTVSQNGWNTGRDAYGFGDDIVKRAAGAKFGLGGHQAIENRSYIAQNDSQGSPERYPTTAAAACCRQHAPLRCVLVTDRLWNGHVSGR